MKTRNVLLFVLTLSRLHPGSIGAETVELFDGFREGWRDVWKEQKLFPFQKLTVYEVDEDEIGAPVLRGRSEDANLGLICPVEGEIPDSATLRWRWKVEAPLVANTHERERAGDDFAARVFVVFETSIIPTRTRAINYVWSAHEPVGSVFPSPYTKHVGMMVLRSGPEEAGGWVREERDLLEDYREFFGRDPKKLNAVAIMVDTDNTGLSATAWFDDLEIETVRTSTRFEP